MIEHPGGLAIHISCDRELIIMPNGETTFPNNSKCQLPMGTRVIPNEQTNNLLKLMKENDINENISKFEYKLTFEYDVENISNVLCKITETIKEELLDKKE